MKKNISENELKAVISECVKRAIKENFMAEVENENEIDIYNVLETCENWLYKHGGTGYYTRILNDPKLPEDVREAFREFCENVMSIENLAMQTLAACEPYMNEFQKRGAQDALDAAERNRARWGR